MDDADQLVAAIARGEFSAFETLYDGYHRLVYAIAYHVVRAREPAEDVTQSVFLTLWTTPQAYRGGSFRRWIATVARNRALDFVRGRKADVALDELAPAALACDGPQNAVAEVLEGERACGALAALPALQRTPIELAFFDGLSHREIALRTATPLGTVKTRIRNGLRTLRGTLEARAMG